MQMNNPLCYMKNVGKTKIHGPYPFDKIRAHYSDQKKEFLISIDKKNWHPVESVFASNESLQRFIAIQRPTIFAESYMEIVAEKTTNKGDMENFGSLFEESLSSVTGKDEITDKNKTPVIDQNNYPVTQKLAPQKSRIFADYELLHELGRGGMGIVYKAQNITTQQIVAIKVLLSDDYNENDKRRFVREAQLASQLKHPNIVEVYHAAVAPSPYMVMEYVEGQTLSQVLVEKKGKLRYLEATKLMLTIAKAIAYAHEKNIVHRDLKPGNILISSSGIPKVMDFGLAKNFALGDKESSLSLKGEVIGTPQYMSPEQAAAKGDIDYKSDIYSLGVIYYQLITGRPPFIEENTLSLLFQVIRDKVPPMREMEPDVPSDIELMCLKCLEKERDNRYQKILQKNKKGFADDLEKFIKKRPISLRAPSFKEKIESWIKDNPTKILVAMASLVFLIFVVSIIALNEARYSAENQAKSTDAAKIFHEACNQFHNRDFKDLSQKFQNAYDLDKKLEYLWMKGCLDLVLSNYQSAESIFEQESFISAIQKGQDVDKVKFTLLRVTSLILNQKYEKAREVLKNSITLLEKIKQNFNPKVTKYQITKLKTPFYKENEYYYNNNDDGIIFTKAKYYLIIAFLPENEFDEAFKRLYYQKFDIPKVESILARKYTNINYLLESSDVWVKNILNVKDENKPSFLEMQEIVCKIDNKWVCDMRSAYWSSLPISKQGFYAHLYQNAYAEQLNLSVNRIQTFSNVTFDFSLIPPGYFRIGNCFSTSTDGPAFETYILQHFWMMKSEVTREQWKEIQKTKKELNAQDKYRIFPWHPQKDDKFFLDQDIKLPVTNFKWKDLDEFLKIDKNSNYELPNEIKWEYACRSGTTYEWYWKYSEQKIPEEKENGFINYKFTNIPTKTISFREWKKGLPNYWGLYDLCGNAAEICSNTQFNYSSIEENKFQNLSEKESVIIRGGHLFSDSLEDCSSSSRQNKTIKELSVKANFIIGIRLIMETE